jgi:3-oxoadipate enol-lactonase
MAYRFDGPDQAPVVMMSNSLMSDHTMWDPQLAVLTKRFRVLRYDTRGHGASETTPGPYTIELLARDAAALMDALDLPAVHFVGLSMGGMIAQYLAAFYGGKIKSLALCDTASEMPPPEMWNERFAVARAKGIEGLADSTLKRWFTPHFLAAGGPAIDKVADMIRSTGADGYIACASGVRDMSQTDILARIKAPTVIIVGRQDPACTLAQSQVLDEHIKQADLVVIEDAAHMANIEQTQAFNEALMGFLEAQIS